MKYIELVDLYEAIGATTKRLEITRYIVDFLKKIPCRVIDKIVYLTQGKLYPDFAGVNVGIAEKTALKAKKQVELPEKELMVQDAKPIEAKYIMRTVTGKMMLLPWRR